MMYGQQSVLFCPLSDFPSVLNDVPTICEVEH